MGKKNIRYEMCRALEDQVRLGQSKRAAEREHGGQSPYLHSAATVRTYMQQVRQFGDWLRERGLGHCTMQEARDHAADYVRGQASAWSQSTARAALARAFRCRADEICQVERRSPERITRGRAQTARTDAIERNHADLAEACRSLGARHNRELTRITASDLHQEPDGNLYCHIVGKGGRVRDALVLPGRGRVIIERAAREHPTGPLFERIPSHANVHGWRADYAARCYQYALDHGYGSGQMYHCRDGSGRQYDKGALDFVSAQLGHGSGREYTVIYNYLSYGSNGSNPP